MKRTIYPKKRTNKRKRGNWINTGYRYSTLSLRRPSTLPDTMFVVLDYGELIGRITGGATISDQIFRGNSVFAPYTVSGHQPNGFDQFSAFYGRYRVYASSCEFSVTNNLTNGALITIVPNTDSTAFTVPNDQIEAVRAKSSRWMGPVTGNDTAQVKHYMTTRAVIGLTKREIDDDTYGALISANPARLWYWHCIFQSAVANVDFALKVHLKYYVEFYGRLALGAS